jgi:formylglycine-generating enzyme required for sulfatase activity
MAIILKRTLARIRPLVATGILLVVTLAGTVYASDKKGAKGLTAVYRDPLAGIEFIAVPGGCFFMGDTFKVGQPDEQPVHDVCVDTFFMSKHEVTVDQFRRFTDATGYQTDAEKSGACWSADEKSRWEMKRGASWRNPGFPQKPNHPAVCISWNDAVEFTRWLTRESRKVVRLPTEAEWEYAARDGGKIIKYAWGNGKHPSANVADEKLNRIFNKNDAWSNYTDGYIFTAPVGSFKPNELGLFDMTGNAAEWVNDWYDGMYYLKSPRNNPKGAATGTDHILRGGSWYSGPVHSRVTERHLGAANYANGSYGFRVVMPVIR